MCPIELMTALGAAGGTGAAVGGATAAAAGASTLSFGTILSGIGSVVSAIGQMQAGAAQAAQMQHQAQIAEYNAKVADNDAILAQRAAQADADTVDRRKRITIAQQSANFAASGVVIDEGSTLEVLGDTAAEFELERLNTLHEGELRKRANLIAGVQGRANKTSLLAQAKSAKSAGVRSGMTTLAKGATEISKTKASAF